MKSLRYAADAGKAQAQFEVNELTPPSQLCTMILFQLAQVLSLNDVCDWLRY